MFDVMTIEYSEWVPGDPDSPGREESLAESLFVSAWLALTARYENGPDDLVVFHFDDARLMQFTVPCGAGSDGENLAARYASGRARTTVAPIGALESAKGAVCFMGPEEIAGLSASQQGAVKIACDLKAGAAAITFNGEYYGGDAAGLFVERLRLTVQALASGPDPADDDAVALREIEVIAGFHAPPAEPESHRDVLRHLEAVAARRPAGIALLCGHREISYADLICRVRDLAARLIDDGVRPGDRVGLAHDDRTAFVIGMLAVLRTGASFVPLDWSLPESRFNYMLNDSGIRFILSDRQQARAFDGCALIQVSGTEVAPSSPDAAERAAQSPEFDPGSEAYVIYTSGSTGDPKGVSISRASLSFYSATAVALYDIAPEDRVLQFSSIFFDAMIEEVFPTLAAGATLVVGGHELSGNVSGLLDLTRDQRVTVLNFPTTYWKSFSRYQRLREELWPGVRLVIIGGEAVSPRDLEAWTSSFPETPRLINTYGPTETTVVTTAYTVPAAAKMGGCIIGRPIPGSKVYLLDKSGRVAPICGVGEICIGGPGLARGYTCTQFDKEPGRDRLAHRFAGDLL